jgi:hypothetical protein
MSDNNPNQLKMDLEQVDPNIQKLCDDIGITVEEFDSRVDTMPSTGDAWRTLGASQSQIDKLYRGPLDQISSEAVVNVKKEVIGVSAEIRERAEPQLYATKKLSEASSLDGLVYAIKSGHPEVQNKYGLDAAERFSRKANMCRDIGEKALDRAYGDSEALIEIGFDRDAVELDKKNNKKEFVASIIGPGLDEKKARAKHRRNMKRQLK